MSTIPERLHTVRQMYRLRGDGKTAADVSYAIYVGVLLLGAVAFPWVRAVALTMAEPEVLLFFTDPAAGQIAGVACGMMLVGLAVLGTLRGPALLAPFFTAALAGNDLPRSRTLLRPFLAAAFGLMAVLVGAAVTIGGVLLSTGSSTALQSIAFVAGTACFSVLGGVAWLAGQARHEQNSGRLPTVLLAVVLFAWLVPVFTDFSPWGWLGLLWPSGEAGNQWALVGLAAVAGVAASGVPRLLNSLTGTALLEQAHHWQAAGTFAWLGDANAALANYRVPPRRGRTWQAVKHVAVPLRFIVRDFVGVWRTPYRALAGTISMVFGNLLLFLAPILEVAPAWLYGGLGASLCYMAAGVFSDGFRHAAETASAPALYGYSTPQLYGLHALLPASWALMCTAIAAGCAAVAGAPISLAAAAVPLVLVAVRAYDSIKGQLPLTLLTPMPTQFGDMSTIAVLAWQADALLISTAVGAVTVALAANSSPIGTAIFLGCAEAAMLVMTRRRMRNQ
ncbi:hypothetical protein ART_0564 [Arthrobacter sp. PAMC 25486]|uniref:hypothetical protein n=1 Tax=Arthrobacter sp. PAMC 25486 TaxID=1494608 RepID=UPI000536431A|nr:hypothetical protein [Arthrobacter sp. PAMC 25486]AIY00163.1 hypothetical protein ART_0564 [Arthrobacter sp. PAMC 25486]